MPIPKREQIDLGEGFVGIAEKLDHLAHLVARRHHPHPVAQVKHGITAGQQVHVAATHTGDNSTETLRQLQIRQLGAGHRRLGDEDAAEVVVAAIHLQVDIRDLAHVRDDICNVLGGADHADQVAQSQLRVACHEA